MANELYSIDSEKKILNLLLSNNKLVTKVAGSLLPADFFVHDHQILFKAMEDTYSKHSSLDLAFLIEELTLASDKSKDDWGNILGDIGYEQAIESNIDKYIDLVKDKKQTRDLKDTLAESVNLVSAGGDTVNNLIGEVESKILNISKNREMKDFTDVEELTNEYLLKLDRIRNEGFQEGVKTGIPALDQKLGGLKGGQFIILAGRPSMGKTAVGLDIAKNVAKNGRRVAFFSLEMPSDQLITRLISSESMVNGRLLTDPNKQLNQMAQQKVAAGIETVKSLKLWIDDSATLKTGELAWKARKLKDMQGGLDLIIIDYLQLIDGDSKSNESRQQAVSDISRQLKALARELDVPVIALSQLSRAVEKRDNKRPMMSDIRESGAIEQDADIIMFVYREQYYNNKEQDNTASHSDLEIIVGKHRNGAVGTVNLGLDLEHGKVVTLTTKYVKD